MRKTMLGLIIALFAFAGNIRADIKLPAIIGDHMVLKQKSSVPLWGTENPNTTINIETSWDKKTYSGKSDASGNWMIYVNTPKAGGAYTITFKGKNSIKVEDVLIGEVWISAGQSNMAFKMSSDKQKDIMLPQANNDQIRLFKPGRQMSQEEKRTFKGSDGWMLCTSESAKNFSAMSYYFAKELQAKLKVPVGIINASWGGTPAEAWTSTKTMISDPELKKIADRWDNMMANYEQDSIQYTTQKEAHEKDKNVPAPKRPGSMYNKVRPQRQYGVLYNGMVAPCTPYALSGMLWYQGTSNRNYPEEYEYLLNSLILSWRKAFNNPDMPAIVGQITAYKYESNEKAFLLREAQLNQRKLNNTYVFCSMDEGDLKDIHPTNKKPYGDRFAWLALNKVYGMKDIACMCPSFKSIKAENDKLIISFNDATGLYVKDKLEDIQIAGEDGKFVNADASVEKDQLIVSSPEVKSPTQVRYLYNNNTNKANLYNGDNLPAFPFRAAVK